MKKQNNIVGKAKGSLTVVLIFLLAAGWLCALFSMAVDQELRAQTELIRSAEQLLEDKLYVRAADAYLTALNDYQTKNNEQIELGLADIYREGEMWDEYYELLRERISQGKASAEEYLILAQFYLDSGDSYNAVPYLEQGRAAFPDNEELIALDEEVRYEVSAASSTYQIAGIPSSDYYIPVSNGERWGYILENGRTALDFKYEEALRFSGNYAVVKLDGVYTLIDKNGYWNAVDKNGLEQVTSICGTRIVAVKDGAYGIYTNTFVKLSQEDYENVLLSSNGMSFVQKGGKWALLDENLEQVTDYVFTDVAANSQGEVFYRDYAVVADEQGYYLIYPNGEACFDTRFADAKGIESGLVAVADSEGRWGYCNEKGEVVIDCQYEDAKSFSSKLGAVKYAGTWGYVNQYNTMVIENVYEDVTPFYGELACFWDEQGYLGFLELQYYDVYMNQ